MENLEDAASEIAHQNISSLRLLVYVGNSNHMAVTDDEFAKIIDFQINLAFRVR